MADSIKSIKLRYDKNPPRMGRMEVEYIKSNGEKFNGTYCWGVIGSKEVKVNVLFHFKASIILNCNNVVIFLDSMYYLAYYYIKFLCKEVVIDKNIVKYMISNEFLVE